MSARLVLAKILYASFPFCAPFAFGAESKAPSPNTGLSEPTLSQSLETIERKVFAVGRATAGLMLAPSRENFIITTPYTPGGTSREEVFGKMIESKRVLVGDKSDLYEWRAFFPSENRVMAFEGRMLLLIELDGTTHSEIIRRTIPWDTIKPPRDRGGEATTLETREFRTKFKKEMNATKGLKASGLAAIPENWLKNGKKNYFMLSRLENFPLLLLECDLQSASQCVVTRGCNVEKKFKTKISDLRGIGISEAKKQIIVGDPVSKQLHAFKFNSCYSIQHTSSQSLPQKIKPLSNLFIDTDERLFITTEDPDDYLNASLYFWNQGQW